MTPPPRLSDSQLDFDWLRIRHYVKDQMNRPTLPDLNAVLYLIGIQELGRWEADGFTKEQKQDLMHVAICELLTYDGFYTFRGRDADGWPHYEAVGTPDYGDVKAQERRLKELAVVYFDRLDAENDAISGQIELNP